MLVFRYVLQPICLAALHGWDWMLTLDNRGAKDL
jgi:hypothetical protein